MQGVHFNERNFKCQLCGKSYGRNSTLRRHVVQVHKEDPDVVDNNWEDAASPDIEHDAC